MSSNVLSQTVNKIRHGADSMLLKFNNCRLRFKKRIIRNKDGMGTIEVIMIIAVLVALALIFRNFIGEVSAKIFNKIQEKTDTAVESL